MNPKLPFQDMSRAGWLNLALAAIFLFYAAQVTLDVAWGNTCGHLGTDYCAFWSAGKVANESGYAQAYDVDLLRQVQLKNFPAFGDPSTFAVSPFAYLPLFLVPFQLMSLLSPAIGFWLWTLINAGAFALYLRFFNLKTRLRPLPWRLLIMLFLSLPVFWNLLDGQVNVWLMICTGEFMRRAMADRPFSAGLWLAGLLLKPQALLLIGAALLVRGSRPMITGFLLCCAAILAGSFAMVERQGLMRMLQVWLGFTRGIPTNDVDSMMNWRMLGFHLSNWLSGGFGWVIAGAGMALTIASVLYIWRRPLDLHASSFAPLLLGTMAATGLVAWHSHIHMAMILIPPMIFLTQGQDAGPLNLFEKWVLLPAAAYIAVYLLASLIKVNVLPSNLSASLNFLRGASEFGLNLWILGVVVRQSNRIVPNLAGSLSAP